MAIREMLQLFNLVAACRYLLPDGGRRRVERKALGAERDAELGRDDELLPPVLRDGLAHLYGAAGNKRKMFFHAWALETPVTALHINRGGASWALCGANLIISIPPKSPLNALILGRDTKGPWMTQAPACPDSPTPRWWPPTAGAGRPAEEGTVTSHQQSVISRPVISQSQAPD